MNNKNFYNNLRNAQLTNAPRKDLVSLMIEIHEGKWGEGDELKENLTRAGYNYDFLKPLIDEGSIGWEIWDGPAEEGHITPLPDEELGRPYIPQLGDDTVMDLPNPVIGRKSTYTIPKYPVYIPSDLSTADKEYYSEINPYAIRHYDTDKGVLTPEQVTALNYPKEVTKEYEYDYREDIEPMPNVRIHEKGPQSFLANLMQFFGSLFGK